MAALTAALKVNGTSSVLDSLPAHTSMRALLNGDTPITLGHGLKMCFVNVNFDNGDYAAGGVEVNMLEASIAFSPEGFTQYTRLGVVPAPQTRVAISQSHAFACADGRLVAVHLSSVEKFWQAFVAVIERPDVDWIDPFADGGSVQVSTNGSEVTVTLP